MILTSGSEILLIINIACLFISNSWDDDFFLACLDGELKLLWKSCQRIPRTSAQEIGNVVIKNDGEVLITSVHKGVATLSRFAQNGAAENQTLDFGDSKPQYVDILESQAGQLYVGGTLQRGSKFVNTVFLAKVDKKGSLTDIKQIDIPGTIIEKAKKDRLAYESGLIGDMLQPELMEQGDGKIKMVIECKRLLGDQGQGVFGMLIITDFNASQNQFSIIPKYNVRIITAPYRNQFVVKPSKNTIALFYYDNEDNLSRNLDDPQKVLQGAKDAALFAATIDNNGIIKRYNGPGNSPTTEGEAMNMFMANNQ
jgi:hypothetical protein